MKSPTAFFLLLLAQGAMAQVDSIPQLDWKKDSLAVEAIYKEGSMGWSSEWTSLGRRYERFGFAYNNSEYLEHSLRCYEIELSLDSTNLLAWLDIGRFYRMEFFKYGNAVSNEKAMEYYQKDPERMPSDSLIWQILGEYYLFNNELSEAIECYNKSIAINPSFGRSFKYRGYVYEWQGDLEKEAGKRRKAKNLYEKAMADYDRALEINPNALDLILQAHALFKKLSSLRD